MQVVQILTMDEQVEHVVALPANLQTNLHPVQGSGLEKLGSLEGPEQVSLLLGLGGPVLQGVEDKVLEQLLIGHTHFDRHASWHVLTVPAGKDGKLMISSFHH